jgi:putative hemolysin
MRDKMILGALLATAAICLMAAGCVGGETPPPQETEISGFGVVKYIDLEGGFYGIVTVDGEEYYPLNLADELKVDGADVTFTAMKQKDTMTIQQWGTPIRITMITKKEAEPSITSTGVVTYIDLEGGFYGIISGKGVRYLPLNLNEEFRVDGLSVSFTAVPEKDIVTIQQWGQPITIVSITGEKQQVGMPNPAAVFVKELGYEYEIRSGPDGEYGVAILPNGTVIDEWELYLMYH